MRRHMGLLGLVTIMLAAGSVGCGGGGGGNIAPVARAGSDQTVLVSSAVTLDGSASSDADGDPITFQWSFVSKPGGSAATLSGATAEKPTMTPDVAGSYVIQLVVNDGTIDSAADQVTVTATAEALPAPGEGIAALAAVQTIFNRSCAVAGCHVPGGSAPMSLQTADSYKSLFGQPAFTAAGTRVIPLDGADSVLYKKVSGTSAGARMPLGQAPLSTADQELIKK
ncbi:MAG: hypothetical protein HY900_31345 [Deltaproteobacteria bacterium]|nr:hypothetical protein [Deltaproteobacteria bacterium]